MKKKIIVYLSCCTYYVFCGYLSNIRLPEAQLPVQVCFLILIVSFLFRTKEDLINTPLFRYFNISSSHAIFDADVEKFKKITILSGFTEKLSDKIVRKRVFGKPLGTSEPNEPLKDFSFYASLFRSIFRSN